MTPILDLRRGTTRPTGRRVSIGTRIVQLIAGALIIFGPPVLMVVGVVNLNHANQISPSVVTAQATVLRNQGSKGRCDTADVAFTTQDGQGAGASVDTDGCLHIGSLVAILYDPTQPDTARLALKDGSSGPPGADEASGMITTGVIFEVIVLACVVYVLRRPPRGVAPPSRDSRRHRLGLLWTPRSLGGCVLAVLLFASCQLMILYTLFGDHLRFAFLIPGAICVACVAYVAVPRRGRYPVIIGWFAAFLIAGVMPSMLDRTWLGMVGTPAQATVTQLQVVCQGDQASCTDTRFYTVTMDDGQVLPYGEIRQDTLGVHNVGDRVRMLADPTGILHPASAQVGFARAIRTAATMLGIAVLVLLVLAAWPWLARRIASTAAGRQAMRLVAATGRRSRRRT
jgi:hypothetical protein